MKTCYCLLLLGFFFIASCKKEDNNNNNTTPPAPCFTLGGYTGRDDTGALTGITDTTDWRLDDTWTQCEQDTFGGSGFNTACTFHDSLMAEPYAYPNPTNGVFRINIGVEVMDSLLAMRDTAIKVKLVLLNQRSQKLLTVNTNKYKLKTSTFSLGGTSTDTIYRIYYQLTDTTGCVRLGHGDIIKN